MKGLLYKEFASQKIYITFSLLLVTLSSVLLFWQGSGATLLGSAWIIGFITPIMCLNLDDKNNWEKFSRALPQSPYKRVGAKFTLWFIVITFILLLTTAAACIDTVLEMNKYNQTTIDYLLPPTIQSKIFYNVLMYCVTMIYLAICLLLYHLAKRTVRIIIMTVLMSLGYLAIIWAVFSDIIKSSFFNFLYTPSVAAMGITAILTLFAASYLLSVIAETKTCKEKLKTAKAAAAILLIASLTLSGSTVYTLYKKGAFEPHNNPQTNYIGSSDPDDFYYHGDTPEDAIVAKARARVKVSKILDVICGKTFAGKTKNEIMAELESAEDWETLVQYLGEQESDTLEYGFTVYYDDAIGSTYIESADKNDLEEICNLFTEGMSEREVLDTMKSLDFYPNNITENVNNGKASRTYRGEFLIDSYYFTDNQNRGNATLSLNLDIVDGVVFHVRTYINVINV